MSIETAIAIGNAVAVMAAMEAVFAAGFTCGVASISRHIDRVKRGEWP